MSSTRGEKPRPRVAVIGGGIFGVSCALELDSVFDVTLFEQNAALLRGATYANHNRHHYGFHYPRSPETAAQCLESRESFESVYGECLDRDFDNFYCVAKQNTKTSPEAYLKFCRDAGLSFEECWPEDGVVDRSKVALSLRVKEGVYDHAILSRLAGEGLARARHVTVRTGQEVTGGRMGAGGEKILKVGGGEESFAFVVNASYAYTNRFCAWFGFPRREFQFNLQELAVIELPLKRRTGLTVQDGSFPSFIPLAHTNRYLIAHVDASQLVRDRSDNPLPLLSRVLSVESNWEGVRAACAEYAPIVRQATYLRSLFVDRVVDAARQHDDARLSEVTAHGSGCWSIFAAKVITCVATARKLRAQLEAQT